MNLEQTKALKNYFHKGFIVYHLNSGEKVIDMCEIDADAITDESPYSVDDMGYYSFETDGYIYSTRVISITEVQVLLPLDWLNIMTDYEAALWRGKISNDEEKPLEVTDYVEDLENAYDEAGD